MKKFICLTVVLLVCSSMTFAQRKAAKDFHFKPFLELMNFQANGKSLDYYHDYAKNANLKLIYDVTEPSEIYYVWADGVTYKKGHMTESYTKEGDAPRCLNLDLCENGNGKYTPITITLVFPDKQAQNRFRNEGIKAGCKENKEIYSTDVEPSWSNVSSLKYAKHAGAKSLRYIFFYEKDGMNMCTFLF